MLENHDYCYVQMSNNQNKPVKFKHSQKSKKISICNLLRS